MGVDATGISGLLFAFKFALTHVVELIGRIGELAVEEPHPATALDGLGDAERRVYEALPGRGAATIEQLAVASGLAPERVLGPLAILELTGLVQRQEGRWRLVRAVGGQPAATTRLV
ncbi:DNA-binding protein [Mycobacterium paraseoulense]|uniref:DNA-binding protein n=1 Tax=Mycobacterium paraseoulense TaxID=590652 RepID=A0A1X0I8V3_9MYCO|nr:DNA-binding protein [Mycobacterium paraseoulense]